MRIQGGVRTLLCVSKLFWGAFILLFSCYAPAATDQVIDDLCLAATLDEVNQQFAAGNSRVGFERFHRCAALDKQDIKLQLYLGIAALEVSEFAIAQQAFRRLAKMETQQEASGGITGVVAPAYEWLKSRRLASGSSISSNSTRYLAADPKVLLNINFNRRKIGLPFVLPLKGSKSSRPVQKPVAVVRLNEAQQRDLAAAKRLIAGGEAEAAYQLLLAHEFEGAGNVEFDYVYGTAAVEAGHPEQAMMILLRVLNQKPRHAGARLELGRALYAIGDYPESQLQFGKSLEQNPPQLAKQVITDYLAAIDVQLAARDTTLVPFIDVRVGYSTNANGATANSQPFRGLAGVPTAVQELSLDQNSLEQDSSFVALTTGVAYSKLLKPRWYLKAGAQLAGQINPSAHFVDTHSGSAFLNLERRVDSDFITGGLDVSRSYVDSSYSAKALGGNLVLGKQLNSYWSGTLQSRVALSRYAPAQAAKDSTDYTLSAGVLRSWQGARQLSTNASLVAQRVDAETAVNSKDVLGLSFGAQWTANSLTLLSVSGVYLQADYDAPLLGSTPRQDNTALLGFGAMRFSQRDPQLKWLFNVDANETRSSSNLFDADGLKLTVGARYDF